MPSYSVECLAVLGDARDRRSVLVVSTNDNKDSYLTEVLHYEDEDGSPTTIFAEDIWCTSMWKSAEGRHFLCDTFGVCYWQRDDGTFASQRVADKVLHHIWGLHGRAVYAIGEDGTCLRFNGETWINMSEGLDGQIYAISGLSENDLYVAGNRGLLAHWNGEKWNRIDLAIDAAWRGLKVTESGRHYVCGLGGAFVSFADGEIVASTKAKESLFTIAIFRDKVYAGSPSEGLFQLQGDALVLIRDTVKASSLSATANYLYAAVGSQAGWYNGNQWQATRYSKP